MIQSVQLYQVVADLVGKRCERAENPYGSILSIDIGPLGLRHDDTSSTKTHGWRHLTVLSPWRLQNEQYILVDWNTDSGKGGPLSVLVQQLVGDTVVAAETSGPAWDLRLSWASGLTLFVFGDCTDDRDDAWFILGTDGVEVSATPTVSDVSEKLSRSDDDNLDRRKH